MKESKQSVEAMKEHSRRLHKKTRLPKHARSGENGLRRLHPSAVLFILSAIMLLCLAMWGCEAQEETSTVIPENNGPEGLLSQPTFSRSQDPTKSLTERNESIPKIVAFGDSLTAGLGVEPDQSYPAQLEKQLQEKGFRYEVINAGVSGETSAGGLRRTEWILKNQPTVVILELGVNDGLRGLPLEQTYANLRKIIERLQTEGVTVVLAGMRIPVNYGEEYTGEFFTMYERLAQEFSLPLIPFFLEGVATKHGLNQGDGVHPTAEGYTIVTQNVLETLEPILKKRSESL